MTIVPLKIAVAVSGGGRSLRNLLEQQSDRAYRVSAVIASRADCQAVQLAKQAELPIWIDNFSIPRDPEADNQLQSWLNEHKVKLIALAGFLKPFPILKAFSEQIINIHPALLPQYGGHGMYGIKVHQAVWKAQEPLSGATVHYVNNEYDKGRIIAQVRVQIEGIESPEAIAERVFANECKLYPEVIHQLALGTLPLPH